MSSPKRKRDVPVLFWVSADEMELIQQKMAQFGTKNLSAYLRKMAVDGYVVQLDLPELKELVFLISPYGLPMAAIWLLGKVQDLKFAIQDLVYG